LKLLFITSSRIGDAILSTGVLNHMIQKHPGIEVTVAAAPLTLPLFEGVPHLTRLIPIVKKPFRRHWFELRQKCCREEWDMILDIRGSLVSYFLKARKRYVWRSPRTYGHRVVQLGQLVGQTSAPAPHLWLRNEQVQKAQFLIPDGVPVLALAPAANWIGKQWSSSGFAALIGQFLKKQDAHIAVFAAPEERASIQSVLEAIPEDKRIDLVGRLSLLEIAACLKRCRTFVGNDSGLMHMAAASGVPTIGLFGPSDDRVYGPYCSPEKPIHRVVRIPESREDLQKRPDFAFDAPHSFMDNLKPETVLQTLEEVWGG
jgi:heptosyltransferase-3